MIDLTNKTAIVTGAGRGIGKAIATKLAELGAIVFVCDIQEEFALQAVEEMKARGWRAEGRTLDVSHADAAAELIHSVAEAYGTIDILVNNAGINRDAMLHKMDHKQWDDVIGVNLTGTYNMMQPASIKMREQRSGAIVNISSASWLGNIGQANYAASKAGVIGLSKTASRELARCNVTVNAICPGFIDTEMTRGVPEKVWDIMVSKVPMGRPGTGEDVANMTAFLCSDAASYITGEVINVGGGMIL